MVASGEADLFGYSVLMLQQSGGVDLLQCLPSTEGNAALWPTLLESREPQGEVF